MSTVPVGQLLSSLRGLGFVEGPPPSVTIEHAAAGSRVEVRALRAALGTRVSVRVIVPSAAQGETAIAGAYAELDRLAAIFSRYQPDTALSVLNDAGRLSDPPAELTYVAAQAAAVHGLSDGAFDVTVKPVLDLLAGCAVGRPPAPGELADAAALVGAGHVRLERRAIRFDRAGMGITLDGIAKGYIADRMAAALERAGVGRYLIDAGGDLRVRGRNARGRPWVIGVRDPAGGIEFPEVVALRRGAVATSGGYERFFTEDREFHHIVTPDTGRSPREVGSASVVAPEGFLADALATAVVVLGTRRGLALIDRLPHCAAMVFEGSGVRHHSRQWARLRVPLPEED